MQFSTLLLLSLSTLALAVVDQSNAGNSSVLCLPFPRSILPRNGNQTIEPELITSLSQALSDNSFNPALPSDGIKLSPGRASRVGWGNKDQGFQVCVQNFYFFTTLTVPLKQLSDAVALMRDTCCTAEPVSDQVTIGRRGKCQDSKVVMKLADGNDVKVVAQDYGDNCCGMFVC